MGSVYRVESCENQEGILILLLLHWGTRQVIEPLIVCYGLDEYFHNGLCSNSMVPWMMTLESVVCLSEVCPFETALDQCVHHVTFLRNSRKMSLTQSWTENSRIVN